MGFLRLQNGARFTNRQLLIFLIPVIFEQLVVAGLGIADTFMVSSLGETAIAGVALVNRIDNFAKQFFIALATGGSVVLAQYIGAKNHQSAQIALKENIKVVVSLGFILMLIMVFFKDSILTLLFGKADKDVLEISRSFFTVTALSYPFVSLYYAATAVFRAMGESKTPFAASIAMALVNIALKYIFIFKMNMGVSGAALSTLFAMALVGLVLVFLLRSPKNEVPLCGLMNLRFNRVITAKILAVSVPNGIEQGMFQLGALAIAGLVSALGTASIAADSIARTVSPFIHCIGTSFNTVMIMVIGQCMGAGHTDESIFYTKHILKLDYLITIAVAIIFMIFLNPLISIFNVSKQVHTLSFYIMVLYITCTCFIYPTSFALASMLRGAGDTKFVMVVSTASMFLFRIGAAYIFVYIFKAGIIGTWLAMVSDWVIRSIIFIIRFKSLKWAKNKVI